MTNMKEVFLEFQSHPDSGMEVYFGHCEDKIVYVFIAKQDHTIYLTPEQAVKLAREVLRRLEK